MKKNLLTVLFTLLSVWAFAQTGSISGKVTDGDSYEPLPGANILIKGTSLGTISDINGEFKIDQLNPGNYLLEISFIGYEPNESFVTVRAGKNMTIGEIKLKPSTIGLQEVMVIASVATDRKTPVAFSSVEGKEIGAKVGNQEFPEVLRSTPSIYVTKQGGGFGDSRINVRGFDQRNTAVMINGIPVNDMENGWVYWSNWAGLSDVTSKIQVQRGLGASKLAVPSIGGSINIITNAADMKSGGKAGIMIGNDGYSKYSLMLSTGLGKTGWAFTFQGTHTRGNGYVDGTKFRGYSYFLSLSKEINKNHSLGFTFLGAPQWHHQRSYANRYTDYEKYGYKYNSDWGWKNGEEFTFRRNFYHKPQGFVNWYWTISEKTELATSAYVSFGRGGGTGPRGKINGNAEYRLPKDANGLHRFDDMETWNSGGSVPDFGPDRVPWHEYNPDSIDNRKGFWGDKNVNTSSYGLVRRASMNSHNWYGLISNLTHHFNDILTLTAGIDLRKYKGIHYRRMNDLLGADAYFTNRNINTSGYFISQEKPANAVASLSGDEKLNYYNDGLVNWYGLYTQLEYSKNKLSAFISLSGSNQGFKRIDYFNYYYSDEMSEAAGLGATMETDWYNFLGGNIKLGANFNINDSHNVFLNAGLLSRQPIFDNVFPTYNNIPNKEAPNQKIYAVEAGYGFRNSWLSLNLNLYHTKWVDRQINRSVQFEGGDYTANFSVDQQHQGVELDFILTPVKNLNINGMFSLGKWVYKGNSIGSLYDDNQDLVGETTLYLDNVKVGDAAQTTFNLGADWLIIKGLGINANYYLASNLFADFNIAEDDFFLTPGNQAWKLPNYGLLDLGAYYNINVGSVNIELRLNVNNITDNNYISESDTNKLYNAESGSDRLIPGSVDGSVSNRIFYGFGRTWNFGIKVGW